MTTLTKFLLATGTLIAVCTAIGYFSYSDAKAWRTCRTKHSVEVCTNELKFTGKD